MNFQYLYLSYNWESLPLSLRYLHVNNNELKSIEKIQHLIELRCLEAGCNQISEISTDICTLQNLARIHFNDNQLTALPIGFENLNKIILLNLQNNKFNYRENDLNRTLWERIPHSVEELNLSFNSLCTIPCLFRNINIRYLFVFDCNLEGICPYIVSQKAKTLQMFNIRNNPKIQYLPFIPLVDVKHQRRLTVYNDTIEIISEGRKRVSYIFKPCDDETSSKCCNCCANCGQQTDKKKIQQMMLMDFKIQKWINGEWRLYKPREWKTKVATNLCQNCIELFKQSNKKERTTNSRMIKKRKPSTEIFRNEFIERPLSGRVPFDNTVLTNLYHEKTFSTSNVFPLNMQNNDYFLNGAHQYLNEERYYPPQPYHQEYNQDFPHPYSMYAISSNFHQPEYRAPSISFTTLNPISSNITRYDINGQQWFHEPLNNAPPQSIFSYQQLPSDSSEAMEIDNEITQIQNYLPIQAMETDTLETTHISQPQNGIPFADAMEIDPSKNISVSESGHNKLPPIKAFMDKTENSTNFLFHQL